MRKARVLIHGIPAGILEEQQIGSKYVFRYFEDYQGEPVSLTMPLSKRSVEFTTFPAFLDGLLPEGVMLDALLRQKKIDRDDCFSQLIAVGADLVGAITIEVLQ